MAIYALSKALTNFWMQLVYFDSLFLNQYNSKNQNNMSTHLTIKNKNAPIWEPLRLSWCK